MSEDAYRDLFPILPWNALHGWDGTMQRRQGLETIADCNFTLAGFVRPEDLVACEDLGLAGILLGDPNVGAQPNWGQMSDENIDRIVQQWVQQTENRPATYGFYVYDEPGANDFAGLGRIVAAIKRLAPGKLAYINLFPNYATLGAKDTSQLQTDTYEEHLERFVQEVEPQFLSYDNYQVQYWDDLRGTEGAVSYYTNLLQVRDVALRHGLPFWQIVSSNQIRPSSTIPSPANMLFQAYTTLAMGGRSVGWYTYYGGEYLYAPIDDVTETKTVTWYYLAEVNRQIKTLGPTLNSLQSTGVYFTSPAPVEGLPVLPGKLVSGVNGNTPMLVGEFAGEDGTPHIMLVNLSMERSAKFTVQLVENQKVDALSAADGRYYPLRPEETTWLVPGQGLLFRLSAVS